MQVYIGYHDGYVGYDDELIDSFPYSINFIYKCCIAAYLSVRLDTTIDDILECSFADNYSFCVDSQIGWHLSSLKAAKQSKGPIRGDTMLEQVALFKTAVNAEIDKYRSLLNNDLDMINILDI